MTLISRDQMPASTPYEAELRARLEAAERQAGVYQQIALLQDAVVAAARALAAYAHEEQISKSDLRPLEDALGLLDREAGKVVLESMPQDVRDALTAPSVFEEALKAHPEPVVPWVFEKVLKAQTEPLFPDLTGPTSAGGAPSPGGGVSDELRAKILALVEKESAESFLEMATALEGAAKVPEMAKLDGPTALAVTAIAFRKESGKRLVHAPVGNVFKALGALVAAASALCESTGAAHARWCRKVSSDGTYDDTSECTCEATALNRKLDALRSSLAAGGR